jgi:hypothetical protein
LTISDGILEIGARQEDSNATGGEGDNSSSSAGAAYIWQRQLMPHLARMFHPVTCKIK